MPLWGGRSRRALVRQAPELALWGRAPGVPRDRSLLHDLQVSYPGGGRLLIVLHCEVSCPQSLQRVLERDSAALCARGCHWTALEVARRVVSPHFGLTLHPH